MSISAVGGGAGYPPPINVSTPAAPPSTGQAAKAKDPDHDGDRDTPGRLDVKA